jgi:hypothetical protein
MMHACLCDTRSSSWLSCLRACSRRCPAAILGAEGCLLPHNPPSLPRSTALLTCTELSVDTLTSSPPSINRCPQDTSCPGLRACAAAHVCSSAYGGTGPPLLLLLLRLPVDGCAGRAMTSVMGDSRTSFVTGAYCCMGMIDPPL